MTLRRPALALALALCFATPVAAVPLLTGFGGPTGYGLPEHCVHPSDDGSYAGPRPDPTATPVPIDLRVAFPQGLRFFGRTHQVFYLNTNGNITLAAPLARPSAVAFPVESQPMFAPWWANVDTRGGGQPSGNVICHHLELNRLVVTWHDVGRRAAGPDLRNDFQMILSTTSGTCIRGGELDIEYRYNRCEWAAGEGGTAAQVGIDAGNRMNFVALPMSRTTAITEVCTTSNVPGGPPGLYRFQIRGSGIGAGCVGAGQACTVDGRAGPCAVGYTACARTGGLECIQVQRPRAPRCNGLDNDCDGRVDDDPSLCGANQACDQGLCRNRCTDDAGCGAGRTCSPRGTCVERACASVDCAAGLRCQQGECVDACDGVSCPRAQGCRAGHCADLCEGVICDGLEVCVEDPRAPNAGRCAPGCQCRPCESGQGCLPDGRCAADDCVGITCPSGSTCERGACVDRCAVSPGGRLCLEDEVCREGRCVPSTGAAPDGGGAAADRGLDGGVGGRAPVAPTGGCGCRAHGRRTGSAPGSIAALAWALATRRRRR